MDLLDLITRALLASTTSWEEVDEKVESLKLAACDPETDSTTVQNKLRHPLMSSTPMPQAEDRALKSHADLVNQSQQTIKKALVAILAIWNAKQRLDNIRAAKGSLQEQRKNEYSAGGFQQTIAFWNDLARNYGAEKWHLDQQTAETKRISADLFKWKAKDPKFRDLDNPLVLIREIYAGRTFWDSAGKAMSLSQTKSSETKVELSDLKPQSDLHFQKWFDGWAIAPSDKVDYERAEGIGRLKTDDPFGGFLAESNLPAEIPPMWMRKTRPDAGSSPLGAHSWYKFEVSRGPYAIVHRAKAIPERYLSKTDAAFPPYSNLGTFAAADNLPLDLIKSFENFDRTSGFDPWDLFPPLLKVMEERLGWEDYNLCRFWIFLLIGRQLGSRIHQYFDRAFFANAWMPDPASAETGQGMFQLVRVPNPDWTDLLGVSPF